MTIPDEITSLIATGPYAHLTTLNADGSPQVSVVWVGIEDDEFVCGHMGVWKKVQNIRQDPRVALSLLGRGRNALGLQEYLVVYGHARITEGGAAALLQRLAHIYLGPTVEFPRNQSGVSPATSRASPRTGWQALGRGTRRKPEAGIAKTGGSPASQQQL